MLVGTPITIGDLPDVLIAEGLTGLWIPAPLMHSIFVPAEADGEYREHLVAHELAHIAMAYFATESERREMRREVFARLAPQLPLTVIDHRDPPPMLCYARSEMMHPLEQRAEWLATLILCRASDIREPLYPASLPAPQRALLDRFAKMYGADRA
ncbi:MAG: hypothetical protein LLG14_19435 [Nocardiaceae bacterium]|nr:hypothetical protein [Nocardiaceae bacterium]